MINFLWPFNLQPILSHPRRPLYCTFLQLFLYLLSVCFLTSFTICDSSSLATSSTAISLCPLINTLPVPLYIYFVLLLPGLRCDNVPTVTLGHIGKKKKKKKKMKLTQHWSGFPPSLLPPLPSLFLSLSSVSIPCACFILYLIFLFSSPIVFVWAC